MATIFSCNMLTVVRFCLLLSQAAVHRGEGAADDGSTGGGDEGQSQAAPDTCPHEAAPTGSIL